MKKTFKELLAFLMIVSMVALSACNNTGTTSGSSAATSAAGSSQAASGELMGKPWVTSNIGGNIPDAAPELKDDIYLHFNYDYLKENKDQMANYMSSTAHELKDEILAVVKDHSRNDHEIEQLRILFNQAADTETLKKIGFSEVQPYIDMIDKVDSIEKMNELLISDKFPFDPFLLTITNSTDKRSNLSIWIFPNCIGSDPYLMGGQYYQDSEDPAVQQQNMTVLMTQALTALADIELIGISNDEMKTEISKIIAFEKEYGKYLDYSAKLLHAEYGAVAESTAKCFMSLEKLCSICPNLPMKAMLEKNGRVTGDQYIVNTPESFSALNSLWKADNLESIKLFAKCAILKETRPFRDQSVYNNFLKTISQSTGTALSVTDDADSLGFNACDNIDTLSQLAAKIYTDNVLGSKGRERLKTLTDNLVDAYKDLVKKTIWLDEKSKNLITEKLDNMTLNILEPTSGYHDYSRLNLTLSEQGGTLFSNYLKLKKYNRDCENEKLGKPATGDSVWFAVKPTLSNCFYDAQSNSINIYPGYVTSSEYSNEMSDIELIAKMGFTVGHEISHGFDYEGSQMDAYGQPNKVFSADALTSFLAKTKRLSDYYSTIEYEPGRFVDGQTVVGEAAADLSGLQACLHLAAKDPGADYEEFFKSMSRAWADCKPQLMFEALSGDTHPFNYLRVNVNAQMFGVIYDKLGVKEGDGMYLAPDNRIVIWSDK